MNNKTQEEIIKELQEENNFLKASLEKNITVRFVDEKIKESEEMFRSLFKYCPLAISYCEIIYDENGKPIDYRFLEVNQAYIDTVGMDSRGKTVRDIFPGVENHQFDWITLCGQVVQTGKEVYFENFFEGNNTWYDCLVYKSKKNQCAIIIEDITERKRTEESLKNSKLLLIASLESQKDMILYSLDKNYRYLFFNQAHGEVIKTAYNREIKLGMNGLVCITSDDDRAVIKEHYSRALKGESHSSIERFGDVEKAFYETFFSPIVDDNKEIIGITVLSRMISERVQKEQELIRAKENAEESDRIKSAFLTNMSHEIRTPMNGILGFTELLKKPNLPEEKKQLYIRMVERGGVRLLNLINDLFDIAKIDSGQSKVVISSCNINEKIKYVYTVFKPEIEKKGIEILYKIGLVGKEAVIRTDHEKFLSILVNLVKNAIKYSNKGTIEIGYINNANELHDHDCQDDEILFFVKDTGIGIPADKMEKIFERFAQADMGDMRAFQGVGLGLSIAQAYVGMLGGRIWVESEEGKGSTFFFTIPYINDPDDIKTIKNVITRDNEDLSVKKLKILIAEDDESSAMLQTEIFKSFCPEILYAETGTEAVHICRSNPDIDLVMMDIQMPVMNGREATKQIRLFNKEVIIIAQTAYASDSDRERGIESGCNEYISKPLNQPLLIELVEKYFSN